MNNNYSGANPYGYATPSQAESSYSLASYVGSVMRRVYMKMFLGLLVTAVAALVVATNESFAEAIFSSKFMFWGLMIAEFGLVIAISAAINKMSSTTATLLFYLYAIVNGLTLSVIFFAFDMRTIFLAFGTTAATFGAMSVYGYVTKTDLTKAGSYLVMALFGLIIASVINMFAGWETLNFIISLAGVVIFLGLTAWDTQKIKNMASMTDPSQAGKVATIGALELYLDFINLFLYLLRLFGSRD